MSQEQRRIDPEARYLDSHEWARPLGDGSTYLVGISDHGQDALGEMSYVELPAVGAVLEKGQVFGVVESVKSASELYMPMDGTILEVNEALPKQPALLNSDPYGTGWMIRIQARDPRQWQGLLSPGDYSTIT